MYDVDNNCKKCGVLEGHHEHLGLGFMADNYETKLCHVCNSIWLDLRRKHQDTLRYQLLEDTLAAIQCSAVALPRSVDSARIVQQSFLEISKEMHDLERKAYDEADAWISADD